MENRQHSARDSNTRRLMEKILTNEEEHATDLAGSLQGVGARAARY